MTKSKNTKKALTASLLSMLVCVSMLIGSTFAWFTDSVTTGVNKIVAGNLDVELYQVTKAEDGSLVETAVNGETKLFDESTLWEPGHVEVVYLKIANNGTLWLDYKFNMNVKDFALGQNAAGEKIVLSEYLKYAVVDLGEDGTMFANRPDAIEAVKDTAVKLSSYSDADAMAPNTQSNLLALVVYMPTTVGNEANAVPIKNPFHQINPDKYPEFTLEHSRVELGINLTATQHPEEKDSFGSDYDKFDDIVTANDLTEALKTAKAGDTIKIAPFSGDLVLDASMNIPNGVTVDFGHNKVTVKDEKKATLITKGDAVIRNADFDGKYYWGVQVAADGDVVIEGCNFGLSANHSIWTKDNFQGNLVIRNNYIRKAININQASNVVIENNVFDVANGSMTQYNGITVNGNNVVIRNNELKSGAWLADFKGAFSANTLTSIEFSGNKLSAPNSCLWDAQNASGQHLAADIDYINGLIDAGKVIGADKR